MPTEDKVGQALPPAKSFYSQRSATSGSTPATRWAGTKAAIAAIPDSVTATRPGILILADHDIKRMEMAHNEINKPQLKFDVPCLPAPA